MLLAICRICFLLWRRGLRIYRVRDLTAAKSPSLVPPALPLPDKPSIAVLPFANMSGDPEQEYFADSMGISAMISVAIELAADSPAEGASA